MHQTTLERIEQELKKIKRQLQCGTQFFETVEEFPEVGVPCAIYVDKSSGAFYVYDTATSTYITADAGEDVDFSLTTTGTSGPATLVGTILNIPQYQSVLTNPVTGTGTAGQVSYWSGTNTQTGSQDFTWNDTTKILSFSNGGTLINEIRVGSINSNTIIGRLAGSSASLTGGSNSFFGVSAGQNNTTGSGNSFFGRSAGSANTTGTNNSFFGQNSGLSNTTANDNSFFGHSAGSANTTGASNNFFGNSTGFSNTTGSNNSFFGLQAGVFNTTGSFNSFFGRESGRRIANGSNLTVANNSVFLGSDTRAAADSQSNQIVIGYQAIGLGSNTTVIGNSSTTLTWLGGSTSIGTTTSSARLHVRGSGTTSSTTALLVQNSTPTELLSVTDDGVTTLFPTANTSALVSSTYNVTGSGTTPLINLSGTWNTTGVVNGILVDITDTASNSTSNILNLRIGGSSLFRVAKSIGGYSGGPIAANGYGLGISGSAGIFSVNSSNSVINSSGTALGFSDNESGAGYSYWFLSQQYINKTYTSGTGGFITVTRGFAPTSGSGVLNILNLQNTINQTGGANGITRGLYVNPTLTAAADWRGIEISTGATNTVVLGKNTGSAAVEVTSTTQGFLPPRMTTAQRNLIATPSAGLVIFNTTTTKLECFDGAVWQAAW